MKAISSSIVVAAGIYGIQSSVALISAIGSFYALLGLIAGMVALSLGLVGWWASLKYDR